MGHLPLMGFFSHTLWADLLAPLEREKRLSEDLKKAYDEAVIITKEVIIQERKGMEVNPEDKQKLKSILETLALRLRDLTIKDEQLKERRDSCIETLSFYIGRINV